MTAATINFQDVIPYAPIPKTVSDMLSDREFRLFSRMAGLSKMGQQKVWLRQDTVADWIACSYSTAGRTIRGIVKKGLAKFTGQWHQGRHKVYEVCPLPQKNLPKSTYATTDKRRMPPTAQLKRTRRKNKYKRTTRSFIFPKRIFFQRKDSPQAKANGYWFNAIANKKDHA